MNECMYVIMPGVMKGERRRPVLIYLIHNGYDDFGEQPARGKLHLFS